MGHNIKNYVNEMKERFKNSIKDGQDVRLVIIQVGDNPASNSYVKGKLSDCSEVGIKTELLKYNEDDIENTEQLINVIDYLNKEKLCHGIIVQLPLPKHIDIKAVQAAIDPVKDVDGFHIMSKHVPCTPLGIINYLKHVHYNFEGKNALVIGRSDIVGKPLAKLLTDLDCTVTLAHSKTPPIELTYYIENADIVFIAMDKIEYFNRNYMQFFKKVPVIIDIGLGRNEEGKLRGNLSKDSVEYLTSYNIFVVSGIGGVGLLTRLQLLENTINAAKIINSKEE